MSDAAKQRVLDKHREWNVDHDWWEFCYHDAKAIGKCMGLHIKDISFSGFCNQGDGASFEGSLIPIEMNNALAKLHEYAQNDSMLDALAEEAQALHDFSLALSVKHRLLGTIFLAQFDRWDFLIEQTRGYNTIIRSFDEQMDRGDDDQSFLELESRQNTFVQGFADWIYHRLEIEHDYLTSDEAIKESIEANELLFDEYGSPA